MSTYGTCHFVSFARAVKYYGSYEPLSSFLLSQAVQYKMDNKEIFIGKPELKPGESLSVNNEGRYVITTKD